MSNNKKSSIDWLEYKLNNVKPTEFCSIETIKEWVSLTKAMERELIKESCTMAIMQWYEWDKTNYLDLYDHKIEGAKIWAEDYVKELYGEIEIPEPNKIMELFNDYTSYCQYVKEEWNDGYINELFESGYIVEKEYTGEYECASRDIEYRMLTESEFNEIFSSQPKMDELTQLRKLAVLLQSAWHHGNWKAETTNEREMEKIMTEQGYWPALPNLNQIK